jgi:ribosomal protein S11
VIAACIRAGDGTAGVAAETVGHQPFAADRIVPVAADIATERQKRDLFRK